ncbi:DUF2793 domain-containing protein [Blastomonas aquatica]|uniref:DUF2793 domain-containing protein n=1 Tax=Blastomonas aquatica TaxID=1510276 RepID=UPI00166F4BF6
MLAAQAQKEITHNEALALIDALLSGCTESKVSDPATLDLAEGRVWIVDEAPVGAWAGRAGTIAVFTAGGWRFVTPVAGMRMYDRDRAIVRIFDGGAWRGATSAAEPTGGTVIDLEARNALSAVLMALRQFGLLDAT